MPRFKTVLLLTVLFTPLPAFAQTHWLNTPIERLMTDPPRYLCSKTTQPLVIDGKLDESAWQQATWTDDFVDIEGDAQPKPLYRTRAKMVWDENYLYVAAEIEEPHLWATYDQHDQITYHENDFEVFIDPDDDTYQYFEIEMNAREQIFDLFLAYPYRDGGYPALIGWDATGLKRAVVLRGTLNNGRDTDNGWTLEMAIPFYAMRTTPTPPIPKSGDWWRINFSRVNWRTHWENGTYVKEKDTQGNLLPEYNWVWAPTGLISIHFPERWGYVRFTDEMPTTEADWTALPQATLVKSWLYASYYRQHAFKAQQGIFATSLSELGLPSDVKIGAEHYTVQVFGTPNTFEVWLKAASGAIWRINQSGAFAP